MAEYGTSCAGHGGSLGSPFSRRAEAFSGRPATNYEPAFPAPLRPSDR